MLVAVAETLVLLQSRSRDMWNEVFDMNGVGNGNGPKPEMASENKEIRLKRSKNAHHFKYWASTIARDYPQPGKHESAAAIYGSCKQIISLAGSIHN